MNPLLFLLLAWLSITDSIAGPYSDHMSPGSYVSPHLGDRSGDNNPPSEGMGSRSQNKGFNSEDDRGFPRHPGHSDGSYPNQYAQPQLHEPPSSASSIASDNNRVNRMNGNLPVQQSQDFPEVESGDRRLDGEDTLDVQMNDNRLVRR